MNELFFMLYDKVMAVLRKRGYYHNDWGGFRESDLIDTVVNTCNAFHVDFERDGERQQTASTVARDL